MQNQLGLVVAPNLYQEWVIALDSNKSQQSLVLGTVQLQLEQGCHVIFRPQHANYHDTKTTFRLIRELPSDLG